MTTICTSPVLDHCYSRLGVVGNMPTKDDAEAAADQIETGAVFMTARISLILTCAVRAAKMRVGLAGFP